jgi:hypothetical protein
VRMDVAQRKVAEREADAIESCLDALDLAKRPARVGTLVVAVLEDEATGRRASEVIDSLVERLDLRLMFTRHALASPSPLREDFT